MFGEVPEESQIEMKHQKKKETNISEKEREREKEREIMNKGFALL